MPSKAHPEFNELVTNLYSTKMLDLENEVNSFLNNNLFERELLTQDKLSQESLFSKVVSSILFKSLNEATEQIHILSKDKKNFNIHFNFTDYIDYLIHKLEKKEEIGPFLAANFIKKINDIHPFPKNLEINYHLSFPNKPSSLNKKNNITNNNSIVGYIKIKESKQIEQVNQAYKDVISTAMNENVYNEIEQQSQSGNHNMDLKQISSELVQHVLNQQFNTEQNVIKFELDELVKLIEYSHTIIIDNQIFNPGTATDFLINLYPYLIKEPDLSASSLKI